ncbi:MAG: Tad domain-containing protein [Chloroflexota bacterium]|nr:Tad domain-containing protein [Chloroflexota bacterium]
MSAMRADERQRERGQVLVLFVISLAVMLAAGGLLFSGAQGLVLRRQLQNASDAAALAAANLLVVNNGCSGAGFGGAPRSVILSAAQNSVSANLAGFSLSNLTVSCPTGYNNLAVKVQLSGTAASFFGSAALSASASSTAVNGQVTTGKWSVAMLDPSNKNWASKRNGCPSFLIGGGITASFEGSIMVNSTCRLADSSNGAMNTNGTSSTINMLNGALIMLGGEYNRRVSVVGTVPIENTRPLLPDPLSGLINPQTYLVNGSGAVLPSYNLNTVCTGTNVDPCILQPGVYSGGFNPSGSNGNTFALRPGVYVLRGGGFAQGPRHFYSVPGPSVLTDAAVRTRYANNIAGETNWATDCPLDVSTAGRCGVLIYNAPSCASCAWNLPNGDRISWSSNGTIRLRAYNPAADVSSFNGLVFSSYKNLVLWQARSPEPDPNKGQPVLDLGGGGVITLSGSVYAPGAQIKFGGGSGGTGGGTEQATIQFVCWDLQLQGNNNFYFEYRADVFVQPTAYGLIE